MRKSSLLSVLAIAMLFAGCTESLDAPEMVNGSDQSPENAISFSTNIGKSKQTRSGVGGYNGDITDTELQGAANGFGVFAYSTNTAVYGNYRISSGDADAKKYPNFMFNEHVTWDGSLSDDHVTKWTYSPLKYWPNELAEATGHDVDDQMDDNSKDPAKGETNSGNVSFFAYAPYVNIYTEGSQTTIDGFKAEGDAGTDAAEGILSISGNKFSGGSDIPTSGAVTKYSDPYIIYQIPKDNKNVVDLLWGTTGNNGKGVTGKENLGVTSDESGSDYEKQILREYADNDPTRIIQNFTVNADMTKQTTEGTINFLFKHALAKVGGSYTGTGDGSDDDPKTASNGLMVVLDLDDMKGAETGGELEEYQGLPLEAGSEADMNKNNTKVTIEEVALKCEKELSDADITAIKNKDFDLTTNGFFNLRDWAIFDLATGQWSDWTAKNGGREQTIQATGTDVNSTPDPTDAAKDAVLHDSIAEPKDHPEYTKAGFESLPIGVTTVPKNVYGKKANPFVFIPGTHPVIQISVTYLVRTYDKKLADVYTEVRQRITKNLYITDEIKLNKQYNILMHLGLTSMKFTATVNDWDVNGEDKVTGTDPVTGEEITTFEEEIEHVYLPINVGDNTKTMPFAVETRPAAELYNNTADLYASQTVANALILGQPTIDGKTVNLSHVNLSCDADWVHITTDFTPAKYDDYRATVNLDENLSLTSRTATIKATYDNKTEDIVITQIPARIKTAELRINDAEKVVANNNTATPTVLASAQTYQTSLYVTQVVTVKANGTSNTFAKNITPVTLINGYTLSQATADDWITLTGTTVGVANYTTRSADRTANAIKATYAYPVTSLSVADATSSTDLTIKQEIPTYGNLTLTIASPDIASPAAATNVSTYSLTADMVDRNGKLILPNIGLTNSTPYVITKPSWLTFTAGATGHMSVTENEGAARSAEISINKEIDGNTLTSNSVTVTQATATILANLNALTASKAENSEIKVTTVSKNGHGHKSIPADAAEFKFQITCNDNGNWASINDNGEVHLKANNSGVARTATITVTEKSTGLVAKRTISQNN